MEHFSEQKGYGQFKPLAVELLKTTISMLDQYGIEYFLISGTLLGYVRHRDIIPWDDDIDLIVDRKILTMLPEIEKTHTELLISTRGDWIVKVSRKDGLPIPPERINSEYTQNYTFPFIDMFTFINGDTSNTGDTLNTRANNTIEFFNRSWKTNKFFPAKIVSFLGFYVKIPHDPYYFLNINYGPDYMRLCKSKTWDHRNELPNVEKRVAVTLTSYLRHIIRTKNTNK